MRRGNNRSQDSADRHRKLTEPQDVMQPDKTRTAGEEMRREIVQTLFSDRCPAAR